VAHVLPEAGLSNLLQLAMMPNCVADGFADMPVPESVLIVFVCVLVRFHLEPGIVVLVKCGVEEGRSSLGRGWASVELDAAFGALGCVSLLFGHESSVDTHPEQIY